MEMTKIALPSRAYTLCFTQRSGSNYLARELRRTGCLGVPSEYFDYEGEMFFKVREHKADNLRDYVAKLAAHTATPNGVFGTKIHSSAWLWLQRSSLRNWLRALPAILTYRRDIVAQTVSYHIAAQTESWFSEMAAKSTQPNYDFDAMLDVLRSIEENNRFWKAWLLQRHAPILVLAYEDFADDPAPFVRQIARFLDVTLDPTLAARDVMSLARQATERNSEWAAQFRRDLEARGLSAAAPMLTASYPGATP